MQVQRKSAGTQPPPIPVTVVAGFLGAGKTTLINHILGDGHGRRIGVVVNDFGPVNIDAELVSDVGEGMVSLANGCICCVIRSDLISAVLKLAGQPRRPEHIVIESSGVADPASVVRVFMEPEIWGTVQHDGVITVVDAGHVLSLPGEEMELARLQIAGGQLIVLNKVDLVPKALLDRVREWLRDIKPGVELLETDHCRLPIEVLLGMRGFDGSDTRQGVFGGELPPGSTGSGLTLSHGPDLHHGARFDSWCYESERPLKLDRLHQVINHLLGTVFRAKGFVSAVEKPGRRILLQLVGRRATYAENGKWSEHGQGTRLVFIARGGTVNFSAVEKALNCCRTEV